MGLSHRAHQITIISLTVSCSLRAHQLCRKENGNTKAARPSIVSSSSTQKSHTVSPKYVFCNSTNSFSDRNGSDDAWAGIWQDTAMTRHAQHHVILRQGPYVWVMHFPWPDR